MGTVLKKEQKLEAMDEVGRANSHCQYITELNKMQNGEGMVCDMENRLTLGVDIEPLVHVKANVCWGVAPTCNM